MSKPVPWTRQHTLAAFHLYTLLPFGRLHQHAPEIRQLAQWEGRTPSSVAMKLVNFASLDPQVVASGRAGLSGASNQDKALWAALQQDWDPVASEAAEAYAALADIVAEVRRELRQRACSPGGEAWRQALDADLRRLVAEGRRAEAKARLLARLAPCP